jgi:hypothetical protein
VADEDKVVEEKFLKSGRNRQTENAGLVVLLRDPRFQVVDRSLKGPLLTYLGATGFPVQAFDAVMFEKPAAPITTLLVEGFSDDLRLVEMKTTRKAIKDERLEGFFFGVTESEMNLAAKLGDRYLFAFVVLNSANVFGEEFFVLLTLDQLTARIRSKRTQFQVTLARGQIDVEAPFGFGPGILGPRQPSLPQPPSEGAD